ncbi:serine/threonine protein kinase, CMGC, dual-specificity [Zalaria obscura]|uniref:Serine/threonine protein kinase, CMGC, dual-specificity n=1 Tax=Zalaria obscura TaxID=2024903 RepID=A0ACC3SJW2_9PEZI
MEVASRNQTSSPEGRARRKFQRTADTSDNFSFRKPSLPASAMRTAEPRQAPPFNRRRSILRDNKPPMGPRPQESSPSKRIFSEGTARSFLPNSASEPVLQMNKIGNDDSFGFGDTSMTTTSHSSVKAGPYEFLPPVSFDDFQTSIASYEPQMSPQLSEFPIPGRGGLNNNSAGNNMARTQGLADTASGSSTSASRQPRNQQFARRFSHVPRQTSQAQQDTQQLPPPPSLPLSLRTRRQSQVPTATAPPASVTRTPRKSVGPGILANMGQNRRAPQDQATNSAMASSAISRTPSLSKTPRRTTMGANRPGAQKPSRCNPFLGRTPA